MFFSSARRRRSSSAASATRTLHGPGAKAVGAAECAALGAADASSQRERFGMDLLNAAPWCKVVGNGPTTCTCIGSRSSDMLVVIQDTRAYYD